MGRSKLQLDLNQPAPHFRPRRIILAGSSPGWDRFKNGDLIMKILKMAIAVACALASTAAAAGVVEKQSKSATSEVSDCYYEFSFIFLDTIFDVYTCYSNGDGTY